MSEGWMIIRRVEQRGRPLTAYKATLKRDETIAWIEISDEAGPDGAEKIIREFAASREMLEALIDLASSDADVLTDSTSEPWQKAHAAIAKATGGEFGSDEANTLATPVTEPLDAIKRAISDYHHALDTREHGGVAADRALRTIMETLGMPWVQNAKASGGGP